MQEPKNLSLTWKLYETPRLEDDYQSSLLDRQHWRNMGFLRESPLSTKLQSPPCFVGHVTYQASAEGVAHAMQNQLMIAQQFESRLELKQLVIFSLVNHHNQRFIQLGITI